jgi:hypothetical protein
MPNRSLYTEEQKAAEREKNRIAKAAARQAQRAASETVEERWARNTKEHIARLGSIIEKNEEIVCLEREVNDIGWENQVTSYYPNITECWKDVMAEAVNGFINCAEIEASPEFLAGTPGRAIDFNDPVDVYTKFGFRIRLSYDAPRRIESFLLERVAKNPEGHGLDPAVVAQAIALGKSRRLWLLSYKAEKFLGFHDRPEFVCAPPGYKPSSSPAEPEDDPINNPLTLHVAPPKRQPARFMDFLKTKGQ